MNEYQIVVRGRDSLKKLPVLMQKTGITRPMIVGMDPLTAVLFRKVPELLSSPVFSRRGSNGGSAPIGDVAGL